MRNLRMVKCVQSLGMALMLWPMLAWAAASEPPRYIVGVVPQFDGREIHDRWQPILAALEKQTGYRFELAPAQGMTLFHRSVSQGIYDFVYFDPYRALTGNREQGYVPLVRNKRNLLQGIIVVSQDGPIEKLEDLQGKIMHFPSPKAFGASLLIRAYLAERRIEVQPRYVENHRSVYLNVGLGQAVAGGGVITTLEQEPAELRDKLKILYRTEAFAPHPIAAHPRVPARVRLAVQRALLQMGENPKGRALLAKIPMTDIGAATLDDYKTLQRLGLEKLYSLD